VTEIDRVQSEPERDPKIGVSTSSRDRPPPVTPRYRLTASRRGL